MDLKNLQGNLKHDLQKGVNGVPSRSGLFYLWTHESGLKLELFSLQCSRTFGATRKGLMEGEGKECLYRSRTQTNWSRVKGDTLWSVHVQGFIIQKIKTYQNLKYLYSSIKCIRRRKKKKGLITKTLSKSRYTCQVIETLSRHLT